MRSLWVYKNNAKGHAYQGSMGSWEDYFDLAGDGHAVPWGRTDWMGNAAGRNAAMRMEAGDLVLCWQSDRKQAIGLAEVVDLPGDWADVDGRSERTVNLRPVDRFEAGIPLLQMRGSNPQLGEVRAFRPGPIQSIYETAPAEAAAILDACEVDRSLLVRAGARKPDLKRVERAAVEFVTETYEADGWSVESVEAKKVGYDLVATKGRQERHLEVKGISGPLVRFVLTANEHRASIEDRRFRLCAVTSATDSRHRRLHEWTGADLQATATFAPTAFAVEVASA